MALNNKMTMTKNSGNHKRTDYFEQEANVKLASLRLSGASVMIDAGIEIVLFR
jgi:hypothetical protein